MGIVAAAAVLVSLVFFGPQAATEDTQPRLAGGGGPVLGGGSPMSLESARAQFPVPLVTPDTDLARDSLIDQLWVRVADPPEAFFVFRTGIMMSVEPSSAYRMPLPALFDVQVADGVPGTVETIAGVAAFCVPPSSQGDRGSVMFQIGDEVVVVVGNGDASLDDLRQVAGSVIERSPAPSSV